MVTLISASIERRPDTTEFSRFVTRLYLQRQFFGSHPRALVEFHYSRWVWGGPALLRWDFRPSWDSRVLVEHPQHRSWGLVFGDCRFLQAWARVRVPLRLWVHVQVQVQVQFQVQVEVPRTGHEFQHHAPSEHSQSAS